MNTALQLSAILCVFFGLIALKGLAIPPHEACEVLCGAGNIMVAQPKHVWNLPPEYAATVGVWGKGDGDRVAGRFFFPSNKKGVKFITGNETTKEQSGTWISGPNRTTESLKIKTILQKEDYEEDQVFRWPWGRKKRSIRGEDKPIDLKPYMNHYNY